MSRRLRLVLDRPRPRSGRIGLQQRGKYPGQQRERGVIVGATRRPGRRRDDPLHQLRAGTVTIHAGQTVEWKWEDAPAEHNVSFGDFVSPVQASRRLVPHLQPARHIPLSVHPAYRHARHGRRPSLTDG